MKSDRVLDCIGLFCPMPIIKTNIELRTMKSGEVLEILADDSGFEADLPNWCKMSGQLFLGMEKEGNIIKGYVKKK